MCDMMERTAEKYGVEIDMDEENVVQVNECGTGVLSRWAVRTGQA